MVPDCEDYRKRIRTKMRRCEQIHNTDDISTLMPELSPWQEPKGEPNR